MKKTCKIIGINILVLCMAFSAVGCGKSNDNLLLKNQHSLSDDADVGAALISGEQAWLGSEVCLVDESAEYEDENISARVALLFNLDQPQAVYAKSVYTEMNPASITTLFTAYVVLQSRIDLSKTVTVNAEQLYGLSNTSKVGLKAGDQVTIEQLLYGMLLCSGVDAANVLAVEVAGSEDEFVKMMNDAAKTCGCVDTQLKNVHGLTQSGHYTSAYDIYLIVQKLMQNEKFVEIISTGTYQTSYKDKDGEVQNVEYTSTVQFVEDGIDRIGNAEILGGKTGTTSSAGHCLALICKSDSGDNYLALVMKAKSKDSLYEQIEHIVKKIGK